MLLLLLLLLFLLPPSDKLVTDGKLRPLGKDDDFMRSMAELLLLVMANLVNGFISNAGVSLPLSQL